jgi:hypothetical protein
MTEQQLRAGGWWLRQQVGRACRPRWGAVGSSSRPFDPRGSPCWGTCWTDRPCPSPRSRCPARRGGHRHRLLSSPPSDSDARASTDSGAMISRCSAGSKPSAELSFEGQRPHTHHRACGTHGLYVLVVGPRQHQPRCSAWPLHAGPRAAARVEPLRAALRSLQLGIGIHHAFALGPRLTHRRRLTDALTVAIALECCVWGAWGAAWRDVGR